LDAIELPRSAWIVNWWRSMRCLRIVSSSRASARLARSARASILLILVFVGVPLNHLAHRPGVVAVLGPLHGFLYIVYLLTAVALAFLRRWPLLRTVLVMLAGTSPFLSFVAERKVSRLLQPS
jgi:integral membrane protein